MNPRDSIFLPPRPWQYALLFCFITGYTSAALLNALAQWDLALIFLNLALTVKYAVLFLPFVLRPKQFGLLHPLTFPAIWLFANDILRKSGAFFGGLSGHEQLPGYSPSNATLLLAQHEALTALAALSTIVGFLYFPTLRHHLRLPRRPSGIIPKAAILASLSLGAFLFWIKAHGSIAGLLLLRAMPKDERLTTTIGGHYVVISQLFGFTLLVLLAYKPRLFKNLLYWLGILTAMTVNFASNGSRSGALYLLIMVLLVRMITQRRIPYALIASGAILAIGILGVTQTFRSSQYGKSELDFTKIQELSVQDAFEKGSQIASERAADNSGALPILAKVPNEAPLLWGHSYIGIPTAPIPSALLPLEKPPVAGALNGTTFFNTKAAVPTGAVSEAYWNFHIPGIIIIFFAWGSVLKIVYSIVKNNQGCPGILATYIVFIFMGQPSSDAAFTTMQAVSLALIAMLIFSLKLRRIRLFKHPPSSPFIPQK